MNLQIIYDDNTELAEFEAFNKGFRGDVKVRIDDKALAEKRVGVLMGDDSEIRKEWIEENVEFTLEDDYKGAK